MTITFYSNASSRETVNKNISEIKTVTGTFKNDVDMLNPELQINYDTNLLSANYCYIDVFNRYYFCEISVGVGGVILVSCSVDVLMSHKNQFLQTSQKVVRNQYTTDKYLQGDYPTLVNPIIECVPFNSDLFTSNTFTENTKCFLLTVSGSPFQKRRKLTNEI